MNRRRFLAGSAAAAAALSLDKMLLAASMPSLGALSDGMFLKPAFNMGPWVYWFWNNGNVTREGITADIEAMARVGIAGVILMDLVDQPAPPQGPVTFMGPLWMQMFEHAVKECARTGVEINMTNGPGWCGSSGAWITPELSMQSLVMSETHVAGGAHVSVALPQAKAPKSNRAASERVDSAEAYYGDVGVVAVPYRGKEPVAHSDIVDVTAKMDANGMLNWDAPAGKWTVFRIGHRSTGASTRPVVLGKAGLECDKLSKEAVEAQFRGEMEVLLKAAGPLAKKVIVRTHVDSWESGAQNWTPKYPEAFRAKYGYEILAYLPTFFHHYVVGSEDETKRVRWDYETLRSEMLNENYAGHLRKLANEHGIQLSIEGYFLPFGDEVSYGGQADEPMAEFWLEGARYGASAVVTPREMSSSAHIYGRPRVSSEAFTSDETEMWLHHPATIKGLGDSVLCHGVHRFVFHRYAHQPWLDRAPGATMGPWGLHYERTNTWWEMSGGWHTYLARCQEMLLRGVFAADLAYLRPEEPNQKNMELVPAPPDGHNYDQMSADALLTRAAVKDGKIVLPDGMSYSVLVLPPWKFATATLLEKIRDLVRGGAIVWGSAPETTPGFAHMEEEQKRFDAAKAELWGSGAKRVVNEGSLEQVLERAKCAPDFLSSIEGVNWTGRRDGETQIYFVANPQENFMRPSLTFRAKGMQPELWHPETGEVRELHEFHETAEGVSLVHTFNPHESVFFVFRKRATAKGLPATPRAPALTKPDMVTANAAWKVVFPAGKGAPASVELASLRSWTDSDDEGVRHFSGTATYTGSITVPKDWPEAGKRVFLQLGDVQVMARVRLNGKDLGVLWRPPYSVDVTGIIHAGENTLSIDVVNLWANRLIGDAALPEDKRITWCDWEPYTADMALLPSGMMGPVRLVAEKVT